MQHAWRGENAYKILAENAKRINQSEDLGVNGRILEWSLGK